MERVKKMSNFVWEVVSVGDVSFYIPKCMMNRATNISSYFGSTELKTFDDISLYGHHNKTSNPDNFVFLLMRGQLSIHMHLQLLIRGSHLILIYWNESHLTFLTEQQLQLTHYYPIVSR